MSKQLIEDPNKQKFYILQKFIDQNCSGPNQLSFPLANAIYNLPNYFKSQEKINDFTQSLIHEENQEFYQNLVDNFKLLENRENVEFLVISCFLRSFLRATNLQDLQPIFTHAGITPKTLIDIQNSEHEEEKEELKENFVDKNQVKIFLENHIDKPHVSIILEYLDFQYTREILEYFLKFSDKDAIIARTSDLKLLPLENIPQNLDLKEVQGAITMALQSIIIEPAPTIIIEDLSTEFSASPNNSEFNSPSQKSISSEFDPSTPPKLIIPSRDLANSSSEDEAANPETPRTGHILGDDYNSEATQNEEIKVEPPKETKKRVFNEIENNGNDLELNSPTSKANKPMAEPLLLTLSISNSTTQTFTTTTQR